MNLKAIRYRISRASWQKRTVRVANRYLAAGDYCMDRSCSHIYEAGSKCISKAFFDSPALERIYHLGKKGAVYTELIYCDKGKCIKLFDYQNRIVQTVWPEGHPSEAERPKQFPGPVIWEEDAYSRKEELLSDVSTDSEVKYAHLIGFYTNTVFDWTYSSLPHFDPDQEARFTSYYRAHGFDGKMPFCLQHGDVWNGNIFDTANGIRFIDFDRSGMRFFLYDLLYYAFVEAFHKNNVILLQRLLAGEYDPELDAIIACYDRQILKWSKELLLVYAVEEVVVRNYEEAGNPEIPGRILDYLQKIGIDI